MFSKQARLGRTYWLAMAVALMCIFGIVACSWTSTSVASGALLFDEDTSSGGAETAPEFMTEADIANYDPVELLRRGRECCAQRIRSYTCIFLRQERLNGKLSLPQRIKVLYREEPQSVYMFWIEPAVRVKRALYVEDRLVNGKGAQLALVEPAGAVVRLFVRQLEIPIHGKEARKSGRFSIDQFGFLRVLERILRDNERLGELGGLRWTCEGTGTIDSRPTVKLVRHLPYSGPNGAYPDARLVVHLDQEWLSPVAVHSFADDQERVLLGSYVTTRVRVNPGLTDADFEF